MPTNCVIINPLPHDTPLIRSAFFFHMSSSYAFGFFRSVASYFLPFHKTFWLSAQKPRHATATAAAANPDQAADPSPSINNLPPCGIPIGIPTDKVDKF